MLFRSLGLHLSHFWAKMQLVEIINHANPCTMVGDYEIAATNGAALMMVIFSKWWNVALYIVWFAALWFHLTHGVWSMFQTAGWANDTWYPRLKCAAKIVATLISLGFAVVAVYCYLFTTPEVINNLIVTHI